MSENKELLESLQIALKLEQEGHRFFAEAAQNAKGRQARQTFKFLADEEIKHIDRIQKFFESVSSEKDITFDTDDLVEADRKMEDFLNTLASLKSEMAPDSSDIEAYDFALKFENGAEDYYQQQLQKTTDPVVKKFYDWLINEEEMHARLIESCLNFARDPAGWFKKREKDN